jgi:hypothetical protein
MSKFLSGVKGSAFSINSTTGIVNNTALSTSYASAGVYTGIQSSTNAGIELVATSTSATAFIDFSAPNVDYKGRILYDNSTNSFTIYTNGVARMTFGSTVTPADFPLTVSGVIRANNTNALNNKCLTFYDNNTSEALASATDFMGFGANSGVFRIQAPASTNYGWYSAGTNILTLTSGGVITATNTINGVQGTTASFASGLSSASSYNLVLAADNNTATRLVIFVNGTTYSSDGAASSATIRNDNGQLNLGGTGNITNIYGSTTNLTSTGAIAYIVNSVQRVTMGTESSAANYALSCTSTVRVNSNNNAYNKLLVLYDGNSADTYSTATNFSGFGISNTYLRYQVTSGNNHVWFTGSTQTMYLSDIGQLTTSSYVYAPKILLNMSGTNTSLLAPEVIAQNVNITPANGTDISGSIAMIGKYDTGAANYSGGYIKAGTLYQTSDYMSFGIYTSGSASEKMRLVGSNFGIGTGSPVSSLQVAGDISTGNGPTAGFHAGLDNSLTEYPGYASMKLSAGTNTTGGGVIHFTYPGDTGFATISYGHNNNRFDFGNEFGFLLQVSHTEVVAYNTFRVANTFKVNSINFTSTQTATGYYFSTSLTSTSGTQSVLAELTGSMIANAYFSTSDKRIKTNITNITNIDNLHKLRPVTYNLIDHQRSNKLQYGLIAQEVEEIYPEIVIKNRDYIPNIMSFGKKIRENVFSLDNILPELIIGKYLCCYITIGDGNEEQVECKILDINEDKITIDIKFDRIFIYGTYEDDVRSIKYENFVPILIKDSQEKSQILEYQTSKLSEQDKEINILKNSISILVSHINELKDRISNLETQ